MEVEEGLDTGAVYRRSRCRSGPTRRPTSCAAELVDVGHRACSSSALDGGLGDPEPQVGEPTYAAKIEPAELELDWAPPGGRARPAGARRRGVDHVPGPAAEGAGAPEPATRPTRRRSRRLDGAVVGTGDGALELVEVQPEGKGRRRCRRRGATARTPVPTTASAPDVAVDRPGRGRSAGAVDALRAHRPTSGAYANLVLPALLDRSEPRRARPGLRHRARLRHHPHAPGAATALVDRFIVRDPAAERPHACCGSAPTSSLFAGVPAHAAVSATVEARARQVQRLRQRRAAPGRRRAGRVARRRHPPELPGLDRRPARRPTSADATRVAALEA